MLKKLKTDTFCAEFVVMSEEFNVLKIADDIWASIFCFLNVIDFLSVNKSCIHFNKLAMSNKYWEIQCKYLWFEVESNRFKTKDWKKFYMELVECTKALIKDKQSQYYLYGKIKNARKLHINLCQSNEIDKYFKGISLETKNFANDENVICVICDLDLLAFFKVLVYGMSDKQLNNVIEHILGNTCILNIAIETNATKILNFLLGHDNTNANTNANPNTNNYEIKYNFPNLDVNCIRCPGRPLQMACFDRLVPIVSLLLNHPNMNKDSVDGVDSSNVSILQGVCRRVDNHLHTGKDLESYIAIVKLLINDKRCNVNNRDQNGETALFNSITHQYPDISTLLIENKHVDVNLQSNVTGNTVLHYAVIYSSYNTKTMIKVIKKLLTRKDLNLGIKNFDGQTALNLVHPSAKQLLDIFNSINV